MRNLTEILLPLFQGGPTDILPGAPPISTPQSSSRVQCEFCECSLTTRGEVLKFSDKAKGFRSHEETLSTRDKRIAALETDLSELNKKIAALSPAQRDAFDLVLD